MKSKQTYINNLEPGQFIAFKHGDRMISAKVVSTSSFDGEVNTVEVVTKNASRYRVNAEDISWVRTGTRWPAGIYNALKANGRKDENSGESKERLVVDESQKNSR